MCPNFLPHAYCWMWLSDSFQIYFTVGPGFESSPYPHCNSPQGNGYMPSPQHCPGPVGISKNDFISLLFPAPWQPVHSPGHKRQSLHVDVSLFGISAYWQFLSHTASLPVLVSFVSWFYLSLVEGLHVPAFSVLFSFMFYFDATYALSLISLLYRCQCLSWLSAGLSGRL